MTESKEIVRSLGQRNLKDHGRSVVVAAIAGIPCIGGPMSSLVSEYLPSWKENRILTFIQELSQDFDRLQGKLDEEYVKSEQFAYLFERTFLSVLAHYQKEKLDGYKAILVNACIRMDLNTSQKEYFLSLLDRMDTAHILVLSLFWQPEVFLESYKLKAGDHSRPDSLANHTIPTLLKPFGLEHGFVVSVLADLDNMSLLPGVRGGFDISVAIGVPEKLTNRLSDFGRTFCEFVGLH